MSYTNYAIHWGLDQFLTYLEANQLGANDQHLYDSLAVEHNINTATVDGTHKNDSILGNYINKNPISADGQPITGSTTWTPSSGVYQIVNYGFNFGFELYIAGAWRGSDYFTAGIFFFDGANMRVHAGAGGTLTLYYQKF